MSAVQARDREAGAVIEKILNLPGNHSRRGKEAVFGVEQLHARKRYRWRRRDRRPTPAFMTGWRIGCYYRQATETLPSGYRIRNEFSHPVYLLTDGRLVVGAFRVVDAEGTVKELRRQRQQPRWFTPLDDSPVFFAAQPGHYLDELRALYADLS